MIDFESKHHLKWHQIELLILLRTRYSYNIIQDFVVRYYKWMEEERQPIEVKKEELKTALPK